MNTTAFNGKGRKGRLLAPDEIQTNYPQFYQDNYKLILTGEIICIADEFNTHQYTFVDKRSNISHVLPII